MPNLLFPGFHLVPVRNSTNPIFFIAGIPFANRNTQISATATMEMTAASRNTYSMIFSLFFIRASIYRFFLNNVYVPRKDRKNAMFPRSVLICYFQLSVLVSLHPRWLSRL